MKMILRKQLSMVLGRYMIITSHYPSGPCRSMKMSQSSQSLRG
ncbi:hypothetical protein LINPERPRIM_LOCUS30245 [Linum perenne]